MSIELFGPHLLNFLLFALNLLAGLIMLGLFTALYIRITPYDEVAEISQGHIAPAIALAGAMLGFTFPLLIVCYAQSGFWDFIAWGALAGVVQTVVFWSLHALLPRVIETNNAAGALCFAAASVCAGLIAAASLVP